MLFSGHATGEQLVVYGITEDGNMGSPLKPLLHLHPPIALGPKLFDMIGHDTGKQDDKKNGAILDAPTLPRNPALHPQPRVTSIPELFSGHTTAEQ